MNGAPDYADAVAAGEHGDRGRPGADALDRRILDMLGQDGRRPFTAIAAELGVSESTVRSHVARLEESQVLRIVALCNPLTLGHLPVRLYLTVRDRAPRSVASALVSVPAVNHVALCTGARDVYVEATCRDLDQVTALLDEVRRVPGVATIDVHVLTTLHKDYSWVGLRGGLGQQTTVPD